MTTLHERISQVKTTNPYFQKDLKKALNANKFIGRGSSQSSTHKYMVAAGDKANCGHYEATDIIFVSAEGARGGRLAANLEELALATQAGATVVTDDEYNRNRSYNVGEREVAKFLLSQGYTDKRGVWTRS